MHFIALGNWLVCMLLLIRIAIIGLRLFTASLKILGPFNPAAFDGSKAFIYDYACSEVANGISKWTPEGILSFIN